MRIWSREHFKCIITIYNLWCINSWVSSSLTSSCAQCFITDVCWDIHLLDFYSTYAFIYIHSISLYVLNGQNRRQTGKAEGKNGGNGIRKWHRTDSNLWPRAINVPSFACAATRLWISIKCKWKEMTLQVEQITHKPLKLSLKSCHGRFEEHSFIPGIV